MLPLMNAAGMVKRPGDVEPLLALNPDNLSAITLGGYVYSLEERLGNAGQGATFWDDGSSRRTALNSLGLPGPAWREIEAFMPELVQKIHDSGKRVRVNISEFSPEGFRDSTERFLRFGVDEIEINLGCPNTSAPIASYDPPTVAGVIDEVGEVSEVRNQVKIAVKLSPLDPSRLVEVARVINSYAHIVHKVVSCNTWPSALGFDHETSRLLIGPNKGRAGLSGGPLKHMMLGNVSQLREQLSQEIGVVACGGIMRGYDLKDAELVGASEAQIGTGFFCEGAKIFPQIVQERIFMDVD